MKELSTACIRRDDATLSQVIEETRCWRGSSNDLRTLANAESGTLTLQKEPTDVAVLIQDVVSSFSAEAGNVSVRMDAAADLPLIAVDPLRIREVLANLRLKRAAAYAPRGRRLPERSCDGWSNCRDGGGHGSRYRSGRSAEDLRPILQGNNLARLRARADDCPQSGRAHGGEIVASSRKGEGTIITLTLPTG